MLRAHRGTRLAPAPPRDFFHEGRMALNLDSYLGVHAQALTLEAQRTQLLAANLANADTPNYKARDIDFKAALAAAGGAASGAPLALSAPNAAPIAGQSTAGTD